MNPLKPFIKRQIILALVSAFIMFSCKKHSQAPLTTKVNDWTFPEFVKVDSLNPILNPSDQLEFTDPITGNLVKWEERNVLNPTAVIKDDKVFLMYRAQDMYGTSRIGMAVSDDGLHFEKMQAPVFYPDNDTMKLYEWNYKKGITQTLDPNEDYFDGAEDPRIVESASGDYIMTYTSYDGKTARLSIASSKDLLIWKKHGLVLKADKYKDLWSKSGAIVCELQGHRMVAKQINGKYWMYYGDTDLFMATSTDLIHWEVAENAESGKPITVLHPRMGYFDSRLVEPGPYALLKDEGIVLIYNGSNAANFNDPNLPKFTYAAGQALFDKNEPYKLIARTDDYFIYPDKDYEKVGEVNEVCFVEGLVFFKDQWFLYYGTADSKIAVAVANK
ncbi:putative GH43/DUF377 family glycosyl hydrolase [Flavobacteriaceae bacterium MAR_2010_105]|nr:putative GH43/DUF377 family glycosyl hydrolase [Flavobacteriaceae bacterium MAR_2010_105]